MSNYEFTNTWFENTGMGVWDQLIPHTKPKSILEIGSYEGKSTCYLIDKLGGEQKLNIHCVDSWEGGVEHDSVNMNDVEKRFDRNVAIAMENAQHAVEITKHKGYSDVGLAKLLTAGYANSFDLVYVDGSHQAPDVLCDAVLAFRLARVGGLIIFDDYTWSEQLPAGTDPIRCPKPAIDAFTNIYCRKLSILNAPLYQLYVIKTQE